MDYSTKLLSEIEEMAQNLTPVSDIGVLLGLKNDEYRQFLDDVATVGSDVWEAFHKGKAWAAMEIRKRDIELAKAGSPSAVDALRLHLRMMDNTK